MWPRSLPEYLSLIIKKGQPEQKLFCLCFSWVCVRWVRPTVMFREGPPSCQCCRRWVWGSGAKCEAVLCGGGASRKWHDPLGDAELSGLPCLCCWETWLTAAAGLWWVVRLKLRLQDGVQKETNSRILQQFWAAAGPQRVSLKMKPENCFQIANG